MAEKPLHNRVDKRLLKQRLMQENFRRRTLSFYRYVILEDPQAFRDALYASWDALGCFGRVYVAREGINAQMSVPEHNAQRLLDELERFPELRQMPIKWAIEDDGKSFYKLTLKVRPKIVADGLDDGTFDVTNVGRHLSAEEFHEQVAQPGTIVVDMRNHYESEVGHFQNAICPDADTFRDEIELVVDLLRDNKEQKVLLYCTGGIRCEKASAYLKHHGFQDVNQLHGGIIEYAQRVKAHGWESRFVGKNFVFDERLGERITDEVVSHCHQCGKPSDLHTNCRNEACHLLFIQCPECASQHGGCCSPECRRLAELPEDERRALRQEIAHRKDLYKSRLRPRLAFSAGTQAGPRQ